MDDFDDFTRAVLLIAEKGSMSDLIEELQQHQDFTPRRSLKARYGH